MCVEIFFGYLILISKNAFIFMLLCGDFQLINIFFLALWQDYYSIVISFLFLMMISVLSILIGPLFILCVMGLVSRHWLLSAEIIPYVEKVKTFLLIIFMSR